MLLVMLNKKTKQKAVNSQTQIGCKDNYKKSTGCLFIVA